MEGLKIWGKSRDWGRVNSHRLNKKAYENPFRGPIKDKIEIQGLKDGYWVKRTGSSSRGSSFDFNTYMLPHKNVIGMIIECIQNKRKEVRY